ncbi:hypothetical protein [Quatrionicoccus australiensis]|uniref:hypothetical protein n=1 Tax=Quatrionicoccus australiensis TaxID=138118 RepID=UPI001CF8A67B|nr:hypothetical protein [Quatrionicoccus australiensis]UCV13768.1 hypothetical protein KI612_12465 [Quatrionicoccus australiensis]
MGALDRILKRGRSSDRLNDIARGLAELRKFGANAHLYLPGPGIPILGPELVVNGDFGSSEGWALGGWLVSGGNAVATSLSAWSSINRPIAAVKGRVYEVTMVVSSCVSGGVYVQIGTYPDAQSGAVRTGPGTYTDILTTPADSSLIEIACHAAGFYGSVESITVKEILGYTNTISGITAGNYFDSIGTTHASVDGLVGLVLDGAGSVGSDLSPAGPLNLQSAAWFQSAGCNVTSATTLTFSGPNEEIIQEGTSEHCAGKTYKCTLRASGNGIVYLGVTNKIDFAARETVSLIAAVTTTTVYVTQNSTPSPVGAISIVSASATAISIESITWQEVTGTHATQATTGNKPPLRRGIVNLLTYSNDLSNAAWFVSSGASKDSATTASVTSATNSTLYHYVSGLTTGLAYTAGVQISGPPGTQIRLRLEENGGSYNGTETLITLSSTPTIYATSFTVGAITQLGVLVRSVGTACQVTVSGAALFQGTYTAEQILAAGGIPLTTTAPASSNVGAYSWAFDGVYDNLSTPIDLSNSSYTFSVCGSVNTIAATSLAFSGTAASLNMAPFIGVTSGGGIGFGQFSNDLVSVGGLVSAGTPYVITGSKGVSGRKVRKNGSVVASDSNTTELGGSVGLAIGGGQGWDKWNGKIYSGVVIKGTVSDAQLLIFERMINALSGYAAGRF